MCVFSSFSGVNFVLSCPPLKKSQMYSAHCGVHSPLLGGFPCSPHTLVPSLPHAPPVFLFTSCLSYVSRFTLVFPLCLLCLSYVSCFSLVSLVFSSVSLVSLVFLLCLLCLFCVSPKVLGFPSASAEVFPGSPSQLAASLDQPAVKHFPSEDLLRHQ